MDRLNFAPAQPGIYDLQGDEKKGYRDQITLECSVKISPIAAISWSKGTWEDMFERLVAFSAGLMMDSEFILAYHKLSLDVWNEKKGSIWFSTKNILKFVNRLWACGISRFPWWAPGRVKYYHDDKKAKCRYNNISLILHAWSNSSEIYDDWRMKERTYLGGIDPRQCDLPEITWHHGVCSWSEALADLMNNCGQTRALWELRKISWGFAQLPKRVAPPNHPTIPECRNLKFACQSRSGEEA